MMSKRWSWRLWYFFDLKKEKEEELSLTVGV
jgi:hypothetical protein